MIWGDIWIRIIDDSWIRNFDILPFYLALRREFLRWYLVPSRGAVWGTRPSIHCHLLEGVWCIYDWDTGSSIFICWGPQLAPPVCLSFDNNKELEPLLLYLYSMTTLSA